MANYYFLITALPPLSLEEKPEISFKELKDLLLINLTPSDFSLVQQLLQMIDLYNLRALWLGLPFDERGNFNPKELEEKVLVQEGLTPYMIDFLERYESNADRLRYFSSLYASFYAREDLKGFLLKYFRFERELRLVLTALRAKRTGRDVVRELQFEDPTDPLVADILAQKESPEYTPPREFEDLKTLFVDNSSEPWKLERAILQYRFEKIEEMEEIQDFSIDRILAYVARLLLLESWFQLDQTQGKIALDNLSQYG